VIGRLLFRLMEPELRVAIADEVKVQRRLDRLKSAGSVAQGLSVDGPEGGLPVRRSELPGFVREIVADATRRRVIPIESATDRVRSALDRNRMTGL